MFGSIIGSAADVIALVLLFGFTIFVHELGHFLVALWCGLQIDAFSIGFGPAIFKKKVRGVVYKICWFPLGGYVALPQLDPTGMSTIQGTDDKDDESGTKDKTVNLPPVAAWKKILVSSAGAAGNIILAFVLAFIIYKASDQQEQNLTGGNNSTMIGFIDTNSAAYNSGLRVGDEIVAVNGKTVSTWNDFSTESLLGGGNSNVLLSVKNNGKIRELTVPTTEDEMGVRLVDGIVKSMLCVIEGIRPGGPAEAAGIQPGDIVKSFAGIPVASVEHFIKLVNKNSGKPSEIIVNRNGKDMKFTVTPEFDKELNRALIGVKVSSGTMSGSMPWMQYSKPLDQVKGDAAGILRLLQALVTPRESKQAAQGLGGPIMIMMALWMSIKVSFLNALGFLRFLNVNLAILNMLPIPVLDGGHIMFALWEGITRRKVHPKVANILINIFMILLLTAFVLLSFRDVKRAPKMFKAMRQISAENNGGSTNAAKDAEPAETPNP